MTNYPLKSLFGLFSGLLLIQPIVVLAANVATALPEPQFDKFEPSKKTTATQLGWQPQDCNLCQGRYANPKQPTPSVGDLVTIQSAFPMILRGNGQSEIQGKTIVTQKERVLVSETAYFTRDAQSGEIKHIEFVGNVHLYEPGKLIVGDRAYIQLHNHQGNFQHILYRLSLDDQASQPKLAQQFQSMLIAHGQASSAQQLKSGVLHLKQASYTTCSPLNDTWLLKAKRILLNQHTGRGKSYDTVLWVKGVPVFYTPYLNFPIDKRRQTGLLFPTYSSSKLGGFAIDIPFYWNIAPNYDAIITPSFYLKRGVQFNHLFRYLTPTSDGELQWSILPKDRAFNEFKQTAQLQFPHDPELGRLLANSDTRQYFAWKNSTVFNQHWSAVVNYSKVNDDYYFQDFSNLPTLAAPNQLAQQASLNYNNEHLAFQAILQRFQTLHPITNSLRVDNQYRRLPQLILAGNYPRDWLGLTYFFSSEYVHFNRDTNPSDGDRLPPNGDRFNLQPGISLPLIGAAGYLTPTLQLQLTQYQINSQLPGFNHSLQRTLPIVSIDTGLYFDKHVKLFGDNYQQTLEPRLYYLWIPYKDQQQIPVFDSDLPPFSFDQLFRNNRFNGIDRMGDANQLSMGLTTRFLNAKTGEEKAKLSIGQIYYLKNRRVTLCNTLGCQDNNTNTVGAINPFQKSSPIVGQLNYTINPKWSINAGLAWDPYAHATQNGNISFQYQPKSNHIINLSYNFVRFGDQSPLPDTQPNSAKNNLNQAAINFAWPLQPQWRAVGSWTYNISHGHAQAYFYGLEYNTCCWAARVVTEQSFSGYLGQTPLLNRTIYLQLRLKGLGDVGTSTPGKLLTNTIGGYQDRFGLQDG